MIGSLDLFPSPQVQPALGRALSEEFIENFGPPALLTMPLGDERAYDFSGSGSHGTLNGGVTTSGNGMGMLGQSWKFDGSGSANLGFPILPTSKITVWALANATSIPDASHDASLVGRWGNDAVFDSTDSFVINIGVNQGARFTIGLGSSGAQVTTGPSALTSGRFYLYVLTYNGSTLIGYLVDFLSGVTTIASAAASGSLASASSTSLQFGSIAASDSQTLKWNGSIAQAGILPIAISAGQVSALYSSLLYGEPRLFAPSVMERYYTMRTGGSLLLKRRRLAA